VAPTVGYRVEHDGVVAALAGDTVPCPGLDALCAGADIYVQTVIRDDLVQALPNRRIQDILDYHSTVEQAATTATRRVWGPSCSPTASRPSSGARRSSGRPSPPLTLPARSSSATT